MRTVPDAALLPLMPPDMLASFIGYGRSINVETGRVYGPTTFPRHIDAAGRGHWGEARRREIGE